MKESGLEVDEATLRMNLWLTQGLVLAAAAISSFWVHGWKGTLGLLSFQGWPGIGIACCVAVGIVVLNLVMEIFLPKRWQDDGSLNEKIFGAMSPGMTVMICVIVGFAEEWLFRGVIQPFAGNGWTSFLFTLVHVRYLKKPLLIVSVFGTSWLLGMLMEQQMSLWPPIVAHIVIDVSLAFYLQRTLKKAKGEEE
ncbi:type II CAAX endopeptidase family protein [Brevibacillus sp. 1238]|uniref:CPBP family intramembrane glutamic endopeptidase n=1 Tax=Brevibacillus sp. 1238 TaxID=2940565 RepID=UPI0024744141|nr:type II CAAX endopeptidase family protein [Brevibacillus sp. 1238]MDH6349184.1 membrane protease YdiL (CAAX protease family) [Brevibacillus sp. 1238]